jgi:RNA polymerase sigma factor (sigma-70 family)
MPTYRSDPKLIQACLQGKKDAWETLVDRYARLVYSIARDCGLDGPDAEDAFQNVFLVLHRRLGTLRDQTRLSSWLITTARRECWRLARRRQRTAAHDLLEVDVEESARTGEWERSQDVREALERLGGRCQRLLTALFLDPGQPNYEQISEKVGLPVGSIGPTRARCFQKLEAILREMGMHDSPATRD